MGIILTSEDEGSGSTGTYGDESILGNAGITIVIGIVCTVSVVPVAHSTCRHDCEALHVVPSLSSTLVVMHSPGVTFL